MTGQFWVPKIFGISQKNSEIYTSQENKIFLPKIFHISRNIWIFFEKIYRGKAGILIVILSLFWRVSEKCIFFFGSQKIWAEKVEKPPLGQSHMGRYTHIYA